MEVYKIVHKNWSTHVLKFRVGDLDKSRCSKKFLDLYLDDDVEVYVKCDDKGNVDYRGKNGEYRLIRVNE